MNLLVTNTRNAQAYAIIRALRPHARKIVATMEGKNRLAARLSHAANSRLVDKRYYVPSPAEDWRAGRIQKENTEGEETYVQAIFRICEKENIDTIFPSFDPHVYVFSKNKERFDKMGVVIPVPDYEVVVTPLDKYRTIRAAQEVGFPCPRTYLPESEDDLRRIAEEIGFPLVIKARFTAAGRGTEIVRDFSGLTAKMRLVRQRQGMPLIQEYIPGKPRSFHLLVDRKGDLKVSVGVKSLRVLLHTFPTARLSCVPHPYVTHAARLLQRLGWWGGATVQTRIDSRNGIPNLMEVNPRLGFGLWQRTELGINEPLMCLRIAQGKEVEAVKEYPLGKVLLSPVEDLLGLGYWLAETLRYGLRARFLRRNLDPINAPMSLKELMRSYKETHLPGNEKVFDPYFRYFFQDPVVSTLWWLACLVRLVRAARQFGA